MRMCAYFARFFMTVVSVRAFSKGSKLAKPLAGNSVPEFIRDWQGVCGTRDMNVGEYLDDLRSLDRVDLELRRAGSTQVRREELEKQSAEIRGRLPTALLTHHDRRLRAGNATIAAINNVTCGGCHLKLPVGMLADLSQSGRIGVCPHCGIFLFKVATAPVSLSS